MMPFLTDHYGNASSVHARGRKARHAVESARDAVASLLGVDPADIIFTSGGTEADNMLVGSCGRGLVTCRTEHDAILAPALASAAAGTDVRFVSPGEAGSVDWDEVQRTVRQGDTVSVMTVNNETGALNMGGALPDGVLRHADAVQAAAWYDLREVASRVDALTLSAHKVGGPKGVGVLMARSHVPLVTMVHGGGQERERRSGTENVPGVVGLAAALARAQRQADTESARVGALRDAFWTGLEDGLPEHVRRITPFEHTAPHILQVVFHRNGQGLDGEMLILGLDVAGVQVSAGSACSSGAVRRSHVLHAIGIPDSEARGAVRFSFGPENSPSDVEQGLERTLQVVRRML